MPRKKAFEEVKRTFENRGYELLESTYINSATKMKYRCPNHPDLVQEITYNNLYSGNGCRPCSYELRAEMKKIYSYDDVVAEFKKRGFKLLDKQYKNFIAKMEYVCENHPNKINTITFAELKQGNGCPYCYNARRGRTIKGENNPSWNGGRTSLGNYIRKHLLDWHETSMKDFECKCFITGEIDDVEIHHPKALSELIYEALSELELPFHFRVGGYSQRELRTILDRVIYKHKGLIGVPLRQNLHRQFHNTYGRKNNSMEQLVEFRREYWSKKERVK
jgi:uncharacterized protein Usg